MTSDARTFLERLQSYPDGTHRFFGPCAPKDLLDRAGKLGNVPSSLDQMLRQTNGAELFNHPRGGGSLLTFFKVSATEKLSQFEWGEGWYVDEFTARWREAAPGRSRWAFGMTNYGGLLLIDEQDRISEWDTSQQMYLLQAIEFPQWSEQLLHDGDTFLAED